MSIIDTARGEVAAEVSLPDGATALRGTWGHTGEEALHSARLLTIRRRAPVLVTVVARPDEMARLFAVVERATATAGLVTGELVPTVRMV